MAQQGWTIGEVAKVTPAPAAPPDGQWTIGEPAKTDAPTKPSIASRIFGPTLNIPADLYHQAEAVVNAAHLNPLASQADQLSMAMGLISNLVSHVKKGAAMMKDPNSHVLWGAERMAGGLPIIGGLMDATADRDIPSQIGQGLALEVSNRGVPAAARGMARVAASAAPKIIEAGLGQTRAMKIAAKNTPVGETAIKEGILPTSDRIQARLTAIEDALQHRASVVSAARPSSAGLLNAPGPVTRTVDMPLGEAPTPTGETVSVRPARQTPEMIDPRRTQGGGAPPMPFSGNATGGPAPTASVVSGPGVLRRTVTEPTATSQPTPGAAPPTMIAPNDIVARAVQFVKDKLRVSDQPFPKSAQSSIDDLAKQYLSENPDPVDVADALSKKRVAQGLAEAAYKKEAAGGTVSNVETLFNEGVAAAYREQSIGRIPGAAQALAREQALIALKKAAIWRENAPAGLSSRRMIEILSSVAGVASGHPSGAAAGLGAAAAMEAASSPTVMGGIGLGSARLAAILKEMSPLGKAALLTQIANSKKDQ